MSNISFLLERFEEFGDEPAIVFKDQITTYKELLDGFKSSMEFLKKHQIKPGAIVSLEADFSPRAVSLFLALLDIGVTFVPLTSSVSAKLDEFLEVAEVEVRILLEGDNAPEVMATGASATHEIYQELRKRKHPGLVLFSSGSTGKSKAAVHDFIPLLGKFEVRRHQQKAISFLLFDHIGGINTLLYTLSNGGCLITLSDRSPDTVLAAIEKWEVELLPTSPTFLNLVLISEAYKRHSLASVKTVTYGTEPMPESTLKKWHELFPNIRLLQTYGLSEIGIMRSKSESSDSLWVKIGGEDFETRVVDGILHVKAKSAMLGYLNAKSPFSEDGWFITGDAVLQKGEFFKILGRKSEIINVGGEKVYPAEVESVIHELDCVSEATVFGEKNPITGQIVCVRINPKEGEDDDKSVIKAVRAHCANKLERFKIPVKIEVVKEKQHSERFKRDRSRVGKIAGNA